DKKLKQAQLIAPTIPAPRPGPGIAPVKAKRGGLLVSVQSVAVALGVLIFALGIRRALGYDGWLPPALVALTSRLGFSGRP
ncbi:hypothetical protein FRC00_012002, partial [Tulasnella sp. 408]